jgi:hypothetical protein
MLPSDVLAGSLATDFLTTLSWCCFYFATLPVIDLFPDIPLFSSIAVPLGLVTLVSYLFQSKGSTKKRQKCLIQYIYFWTAIYFLTVISNPEAAIFGKTGSGF